MIDEGFLLAFRHKLAQGGRLHHHEQIAIVDELIGLRAQVKDASSPLERTNRELETSIRALRIQVYELNATLELLSPTVEDTPVR
jgi:hypothetical protein